MIDIERLHKVHDGDERRRSGKSWYVYDGMLRLTQTDDKEDIFHVSNNQDSASYHFNAFMDFLDSQGEFYSLLRRYYELTLNGNRITFISNTQANRYLEAKTGSIFTDIHDEN